MPNRYRIAIVTRTFPPKGGGIASAHYNLFRLLESEHEVKAFAFDDADTTERPDAVRKKSSRVLASIAGSVFSRYVRRFDKLSPVVYSSALAEVIPAARALTPLLKAFKPDIVIVPDNYVPALALGIPEGASMIWMSRNNYKRFESQPLVHERGWMDIHFAHRMELRALRKANFVICPSEYMRRVFRETYPIDIPIEVIYNFVHSSTLDAVEPVSLSSLLGVGSDYRFVYLPSAGSAMKGKRYVFEIIRRLGLSRKLGFYISGPVEPDLAQELATLKGSIPVYAPGHLSYAENLRHAADCEFAISPTLIENLSNAIVEGLMLGLPFVTFDTGGNKEIVHSDVNGYVVPYIDIEEMIARASQICDDGALLERLKASARVPLKALLDEQSIRKQYNDVFDRLRIST